MRNTSGRPFFCPAIREIFTCVKCFAAQIPGYCNDCRDLWICQYMRSRVRKGNYRFVWWTWHNVQRHCEQSRAAVLSEKNHPGKTAFTSSFVCPCRLTVNLQLCDLSTYVVLLPDRVRTWTQGCSARVSFGPFFYLNVINCRERVLGELSFFESIFGAEKEKYKSLRVGRWWVIENGEECRLLGEERWNKIF